MGLFDYVKYEAPCWNCGKILTKFQSKDADCTLTEVTPSDVKNFYNCCPNCFAWNEYKVKHISTEIVLDESQKRIIKK